MDVAILTTIDVFSDVVCPWCYLGKRRLERAIGELRGRQVEVRWRPFRLDPTIPPEGVDRDAYIARKFGSATAIEPSHRRLTEMGAAEGIDYHFDRITRSPNTIDAHRLVRWAAGQQRQDAVVEALFAAYFTAGRDVGDRRALAAIAHEAGLEGDIAARLATDEDRAPVEAEIENAYRIGVTGVPCFVVDGRVGVMGAQSPEALLDVVRQADDLAAAAATASA